MSYGQIQWLWFIILALALAAQAHGARPPREVIVAIIDTGADLAHPALVPRLWTNPGETGRDAAGRDKATNGIDDDGNGYIDDVHGWNFAEGVSNPRDLNGHGTHITGIIRSLAPDARLMILKYFDPKDRDTVAIEKTARAIRYAIAMKASVINYSAGGPTRSRSEFEALQSARERGVLVVAAAGNEASNSDIRRYYPADYGLSNILSVTAVDPVRRLLSISNYGLETVHLAAPGEAISSTLPNASYGQLTGTSQATAFASGVAALMLARAPRAPEDLIRHLVNTGAKSPHLAGKTQARTVLDSGRALAIRDAGETALGLHTAGSAAADSRDYYFDTAPEPLTLNSGRP